MSMKQHVEKLVTLLDVTDKAMFAKNPSGYTKRAHATLLQLGMHKDPVVRMAVAQNPLLRDMFVVAMYEAESDDDIKAVLESRYQSALSKADQRDAEHQAEIKEKDDEIASLKAQLAKAVKKSK